MVAEHSGLTILQKMGSAADSKDDGLFCLPIFLWQLIRYNGLGVCFVPMCPEICASSSFS